MLQVGKEMFQLAQKTMKQKACRQNVLRKQIGLKNDKRTSQD
jgi:hypothetical protein